MPNYDSSKVKTQPPVAAARFSNFNSGKPSLNTHLNVKGNMTDNVQDRQNYEHFSEPRCYDEHYTSHEADKFGDFRSARTQQAPVDSQAYSSRRTMPNYRPRPGSQQYHGAESLHSQRAHKYDTYQPDMTSVSLNVMSQHLLQQEMVKSSIKKFDGDPVDFWPWSGKINGYMQSVTLSPIQTLQFWENHCTGAPQKLISENLAALGYVTEDDVMDTWNELVDTYGSTHSLSQQLLNKLEAFPLIKGSNQGEQLQRMHKLCKIVLHYLPSCPELQLMNLSSGLRIIRAKLPDSIQIAWRQFGQKHEELNFGQHPHFELFVSFIKQQARIRMNNHYEIISSDRNPKPSRVLHTNVQSVASSEAHEGKFESPQFTNYKKPEAHEGKINSSHCIYHQKPGHDLTECKSFIKLSFMDRKKFAFDNYLCYICLLNHKAANCRRKVKCDICTKQHVTAMHYDDQNIYNNKVNMTEYNQNGNNYTSDQGPQSQTSTLCTKVCNNDGAPKACSKTLLVEISMDGVCDKSLLAYCILDEQASTTLVDERVVTFFERQFPTRDFTTHFASQNMSMNYNGSIVTGLKVRGVKEKDSISIGQALSFPNISDTRGQVATPKIVKAHEHIAHLSENFPEFNPDVEVLLLIGYDCNAAMASYNISDTPPYVHKTPLGYSLVGKVCPDEYISSNPHVLRTDVSFNEHLEIRYNFPQKVKTFDTFEHRPGDECAGLSIEDQTFLDVMKSEESITSDSNLQLPLPLKRVQLTDNESAVYMRTKSTLAKMRTQQSM